MFVVASECVRLGLRAAAVVLRGLRVAPAGAALRAETVRAAEGVRARFASPADVRAAPEIQAFHALLRRVGVNPRREPNSVERLLLHALKRGDLPRVNNLVDAYNLVSVQTLLSLGAHDLDCLRGPVTLRLLTGAESFTPLGRDVPLAVTAGEFGYVDGADRLLCRLDVVQADFSKVTEATSSALLIVEGTAMHRPEVLRQAFADVIALVTRHCGGTAEEYTLGE
jgi:DNA/RNA-binding domain of Phe-tRNA-synthetase-like protein